jgi:hypothetical protein
MTAPNDASATNANSGVVDAPPRAARPHSATWAISSISTQAPSGNWATP